MANSLNFGKIKKFFGKRKSNSHKGDNGVVLVIGGSNDLVGAPALAAMASLAAMRIGIDLCIVCAPEKPGFVINKYSPDLIVKKFKGKKFSKKHLKQIFELEKKADVILIGPGLGRNKQTLEFTKEFVKKTKKTTVIDADALTACAGMKFKGNVLITPHAREFEIFSGKKIFGKTLLEKEKIVKETAQKYNCTILLKSKTGKTANIISDGKNTVYNNTGNAGMTKGGTGDVLAGLCTGFIALKLNLMQAATAAAFVNGKIGEKLYKKSGYGYLTSDFVKEIPFWTKKISK
ncbi:MAG TPA: NAD(P)H-hydrate dehydratase [archaeon]|nr:NAD(P)H-hydrate dehydratase [archaeon]